MKKGTLFLSLLLCLTGCGNKQPKIDKSRFDSAQVTLYYRNAVDTAYPETFRHINPVLLNSELTEKVLDFDKALRDKGDFKHKGLSSYEDSSFVKYYRLRITKSSSSRFVCIAKAKNFCMDYDDDRIKQSTAEEGQLFLNYEFNDPDVDSSFVDEIEKIVVSSKLVSGKDEY